MLTAREGGNPREQGGPARGLEQVVVVYTRDHDELSMRDELRERSSRARERTVHGSYLAFTRRLEFVT